MPKAPIPPAAWEYVKSTALLGVGDPSQMVRQTVGTVITYIINQGGPGEWPEGLIKLMQAIDSENALEQEVGRGHQGVRGAFTDQALLGCLQHNLQARRGLPGKARLSDQWPKRARAPHYPFPHTHRAH